MGDLLRQTLRFLVDNPDEVKLAERQVERAIVFDVTVHADDVGKVIGRDGRLINALRMILRSAPGPQRGMRFSINILS
jgi:predicted RNA-binding protein YlqC (UPF0109 family)